MVFAAGVPDTTNASSVPTPPSGSVALVLERAGETETILLVEQNLGVVQRLARDVVVLDQGRVVRHVAHEDGDAGRASRALVDRKVTVDHFENDAYADARFTRNVSDAIGVRDRIVVALEVVAHHGACGGQRPHRSGDRGVAGAGDVAVGGNVSRVSAHRAGRGAAHVHL